MKRKITEKEQLEKYKKELEETFKRWDTIVVDGCNDPFWSDGCNINLVRNHILYYKNKIYDLSISLSLPLPSIYFIPTPPIVPNNYLARGKEGQEKRWERITDCQKKLTTKKDFIYDKK